MPEPTYSKYQTHKSVHIKLTVGTHAEFRMALFQRGLSMQEVLEAFACEAVLANPEFIKVLDTLEYNKKHKIVTKKVTQSDAETVYDAIANANPFDS